MFVVQLFASTVIMITEAKALNFDRGDADKQLEEKDLEVEISQERDVFPDIITFASNFYQ